MKDKIAYTFTRDELVAAFIKWEELARSGGTLPLEDALALPVPEAAERSAVALLEYLVNPHSSTEGSTFQHRVLHEKAELDRKIEKLQYFLSSPKGNEVPGSERIRLLSQLDLMQRYAATLAERIAAFDDAPAQP